MKKFYSYEEFKNDMLNLSNQLKDYNPEALISIARGGMTIGHFLGESLDMRKVYTINAIHYDDTEKLRDVKLFNFPDLENHKNVVLVDDISDSGDTLEAIINVLNEKYPTLEIKVATIFYKEETKVKPDFYIKKTTDWIVFFWDREGQKKALTL